MTKSDIINEIARKTGIEKNVVVSCVEAFTSTVAESLINGNPVYLRGFGSFILKTRARKIGRNISKNIAIDIPEHKIAAFKPSQALAEKVK